MSVIIIKRSSLSFSLFFVWIFSSLSLYIFRRKQRSFTFVYLRYCIERYFNIPWTNCYFSITMLPITIFISFSLFFLLIAILFYFFSRCREKDIYLLCCTLDISRSLIALFYDYSYMHFKLWFSRVATLHYEFYIFYDKPNSVTGMFDLVTAIPSVWWRFRANCLRLPRNSYWYLISAQWDIQRVFNIVVSLIPLVYLVHRDWRLTALRIDLLLWCDFARFA